MIRYRVDDGQCGCYDYALPDSLPFHAEDGVINIGAGDWEGIRFWRYIGRPTFVYG